MKKGRFTLVCNYKHIGNLQVVVEENSSTVFSILGIKQFKFSNLPTSTDNRYGIIKYSLKAYFNHMIEGFDNISAQKAKASIFSGLINVLKSQLTIQSGNPMDVVKGLIYKDHTHFNWENISDFYELKNSNYIIESMSKPALVEMIGIKIDPNILFQEEDNIKSTDKSQEEIQTDFKNFVIHEALFLIKMTGYKHKFEDYFEINEDLQKRDLFGFFKVVESFKLFFLLFVKTFEQQIQKFHNQLSHYLDSCNISFKSPNLTEKQVFFSFNDLFEFYFNNFSILNTFFDFVTDYEVILSSLNCCIQDEIREAFTSIITKFTNYLKSFKKFQEFENSELAKKLIKFLLDFNINADNITNKSRLRLLRINLLKNRSFDSLQKNSLEGFLDCQIGNLDCKICLFNDYICVAKPEMFFKTDLKNAEVLLYNKNFYIFSNINAHTFNSENSFISPVKNREFAAEFYNLFYQVKNQCSIKGLVCYRMIQNDHMIKRNDVSIVEQQNIEADGLNQTVYFRQPEIIVNIFNENLLTSEKAENVEFLNVRIETYENRSEVLQKIGKYSLFSTIEEFIKQLRLKEIINNPVNNVLKTILEGINNNQLCSFSIDTHEWDDVLFSQKIIILHDLIEKILKTSHIKSNMNNLLNSEGVDNVLQSYYNNDILDQISDVSLNLVNRIYYQLLKSDGSIATILERIDLETVVYLLSIFIQRNIYVFIDPIDYDMLIDRINRHKYEKIKKYDIRYSFENLERIIHVLRHLEKQKIEYLYNLVCIALFGQNINIKILSELI